MKGLFMSSKLNVLLSGLLLLASSQAFSLGEQEINFVHSVHQLGVSFDEVPGIKANIDPLTAIFEMHVNQLEAKVQESSHAIKWALLKNAALATVIVFATPVLTVCGHEVSTFIPRSNHLVRNYVSQVIWAAGELATSFTGALAAINLYDVFKEKNALNAELELNQEILSQLRDVQTMSAFMAHNNSHNEVSEEAQMDTQEEAQEEDIQE
jgi:hypothetical protein